MRPRNVIIGVGLALMTSLWTAPVAFAVGTTTAPGGYVASQEDPPGDANGTDGGTSAGGSTGKGSTDKGREGHADGATRSGRNAERDAAGDAPKSELPQADPTSGAPKLPKIELPSGKLPSGTPNGDLSDLARRLPGDRLEDCDRDHRSRSDRHRDDWLRYCDKHRRDHACGCDSDHDRDWFHDCDRDHHRHGDRDWFHDCDKHHRDHACGCDSDDDDHDGDDDKDKKDRDKKDRDKKDEATKGDHQTSVYPKGAPETGGGPAGEDNVFPRLPLGLTGLVSAGLAGAGAVAERRAARR